MACVDSARLTFTNQRIRRAGGDVDKVQHRKNRNKSKIRARVEHVFAVVKRLWRFTKVRDRGLAKNGRNDTARNPLHDFETFKSRTRR